MQEIGPRFGSNGGGVSGGIIDNGWRAIEPLLTIDVANVVIEPLGVVVGNEDDDEEDDVGLTIVFIKRTGTSSVKWSNWGKCECSILKGKPKIDLSRNNIIKLWRNLPGSLLWLGVFFFRRKAVIGLVKRLALGSDDFSCNDVFVLLEKSIHI